LALIDRGFSAYAARTGFFYGGCCMSTMVFDTHVYVKKLRSVGFTEEQAEVFAEEQAKLIEDKLATKNDLLVLEANLRRDMKELEYRMLIKLGSLMAFSIGVVAVLVRLF
jgi:hypothetical protein